MSIVVRITIAAERGGPVIGLDENSYSLLITINAPIVIAKTAVSDIVEWCGPFSISILTDGN